MRFGTRRGVALLALALATAIAAGGVANVPARAGIICHTIPREVVAVDVNTGGPYFAPPVPNGCYAKDPLGSIADCVGLVAGSLGGLLHGYCPGCHGAGCNQCGGTGKCGHCALCTGPGLAHQNCGDPGDYCGSGGWRCLLHGHGNGCGNSGAACGNGGGLCSPQNGRPCGSAGHASTVCASTQVVAPMPIVSGQGPCPSGQSMCSKAGCGLRMRHFHRMGKGCSACNGMGCANCQGGGMASGKLCGGCGGAGCGLCSGLGLHQAKGNPCAACGGHGCKLCGGTGLCTGLLGAGAGAIAKLLHIGDIEYFVGPGGPVPITPGYVPYVVTTRSPRDYFAFPPFSDLDP